MAPDGQSQASVLVLGGGFGGLESALDLRGLPFHAGAFWRDMDTDLKATSGRLAK